MSAEEHPSEEGRPIPNPYEQKQEARRARLEAAAERMEQEAEQHFNAAQGNIAGIPPGQPILVGHHSERHHRGALRRHDSQMRKGIEAQKEAKELRYKAAAVGKGGISSDDPEAVEKLREKLAHLRTKRERIKALNNLFRKQGTLHETDFLNDMEREEVLRYMRFGGSKSAPYPGYVLQNINGRIRATLDRIDQLNRRDQMPEAAPEQIGAATITQDKEENRVLLTFPKRLSKEDYQAVRSHGFVWSRTRGAFVRKLSDAALYAGRAVARQIAQKEDISCRP